MNQDDLNEEEKLNNELNQSDALSNLNTDLDKNNTTYTLKKEKSLGKNSFFYLIYTSLNLIFPLLTGIYVTSVLLPNNIGQVEKALNLVQYFVILSFLGIPTYGLREISKNRENKNELSKIYSELRVINNISTLFFASTYISVVFLVPAYRENLSLFMIVGILVLLNLLNNSWLYEGLEEFGYISLRNLIFKIISFVLLIVFVRKETDYYIYAFVLTFGTAGNYLLNIIHSRKYVKFSLKHLNLKRHMKSIGFLVVVNLAIEIYMLVDVTMLGFMCDDATVAYYSYGMKIYRIFIQIINTFTIVVVPRIALYYKENRLIDMNKVISNTFIIIMMVSIPLIIGVYFTADFLVPLVYGSTYIRSAKVLKILTVICSISPVGYLLGSRILLISGNESKMLIPVFCGAVVNIICNLVLIHFYAETGAAIASLISECVVMVIYVILGRNHFRLVGIKKSFIKIIIASVSIAVYCYLLQIWLNSIIAITVAQVIGSIIIYFALLLFLKENTCKNIIVSVVKKILK